MKDSLEFYVYRIKISIDPTKLSFLKKHKDRKKILKNIINHISEISNFPGKWVVGNLTSKEDAVFFQFGKITKKKKETFKNKQFFQESEEIAPNVRVLLYFDTQYLIVENNPKLANGITILKALNKLLNRYIIEPEIKIKILEIPNSLRILDQIENADKIKKISFKIGLPNFPDVDEKLIKPIQKFIEEGKGEQAKVDIKGESLEKNIIKDTVRSISKTGEELKIRIEKDKNIFSVKLKETVLKIIIPLKFLESYELMRKKIDEELKKILKNNKNE